MPIPKLGQAEGFLAVSPPGPGIRLSATPWTSGPVTTSRPHTVSEKLVVRVLECHPNIPGAGLKQAGQKYPYCEAIPFRVQVG